jgi:RNA polymerase sigma factor (sigma-70 family)
MARRSEQDDAAEGQVPDVSLASDDDLLARIGCKEDLAGARAAWGEFYLRHVRFLHGICYRAYRNSLGHEGVKDLVADTFRRVFQSGASAFKPSGLDDPEAMRLRVRGWLVSIAKRLAQDRFRGRKGTTEVGLAHDAWQNVAGKTCEPVSESVREVCRLMEKVLTDREQDVIRTTFHWYDPEQPHRKLPDEDLDDLCRRWEMTPENARQVRSRALKKLEEALAQVMADSSRRQADA